MFIWAICTAVCLFGVFNIMIFASPFPLYLALAGGGFVAIILNEVIYSARKDQLEIERDTAIKDAGFQPQSQTVLAICPVCKNRIPSNSKFCLECGTDLQPST
jgi:hypothetical protein